MLKKLSDKSEDVITEDWKKQNLKDIENRLSGLAKIKDSSILLLN